MYVTYRREYENFTHLPVESIDALFQRFTVVVNNMRSNVGVLPYDDHDSVKLLHSLDRTVWGGKFEAIVESEKYDTLTVNELFSKLKSAEVPYPPKTHHKNDFPPKPNHLRNRLNTTPAPPMFPPQTNDFQKPIKFVSTSGKLLFGKESEKASEEKSVEKPSGEKPSEQPQSKPKPMFVRFHCGYCGRDSHKDEFCFKRRREERMVKK
jgi:hypothetical protein